MAQLIFLGTAAAYPTATRTNTSLAVLPTGEAAQSGLLIDCGGDVYRSLLRAGIATDTIGDLFITHAHIDHIGSLPSLLESLRLGGRTAPLRIWALPEVLAVSHSLIAAYYFELTLDTWSYPVSFSAIEDGQPITLAGFPAQPVAMDHSVPSVGLRLELPSGVTAYTCDTQPNPNIARLGRGAATLISEATFLRGQEANARSGRHSTAYEAGESAKDCSVERLVLVHLGPDAELARADAQGAWSGGQVIVPNDGDRLEI